MANLNSRTYIKTLSESQMQVLSLPVGSKVLIKITNPIGEVSPLPIKIGDKVGFERVLSIEDGEITIDNDGAYTLRIDSESDRIVDAYKHLQQQVNKGCWVRFALPSNKPIWYLWQSINWKYNSTRILTISLNQH
jgi:hypothetical protein